jgi:hypothetical protein
MAPTVPDGPAHSTATLPSALYVFRLAKSGGFA